MRLELHALGTEGRLFQCLLLCLACCNRRPPNDCQIDKPARQPYFVWDFGQIVWKLSPNVLNQVLLLESLGLASLHLPEMGGCLLPVPPVCLITIYILVLRGCFRLRIVPTGNTACYTPKFLPVVFKPTGPPAHSGYGRPDHRRASWGLCLQGLCLRGNREVAILLVHFKPRALAL